MKVSARLFTNGVSSGQLQASWLPERSQAISMATRKKEREKEDTILHFFIDTLVAGQNRLENYTQFFSNLCIWNNQGISSNQMLLHQLLLENKELQRS